MKNPFLSNITIVSCGRFSTIVANYSAAYGFGYDYYGNLGFNQANVFSFPYPTQIVGLNNILAISTGEYHTLVLTQSPEGQGILIGFGTNTYGQL